MGRHGGPATGRGRFAALRRVRISLPVVAIGVLLAGAVALGVWWWNLRSVTDPIDADPVDAYAVVVSSPPCPGGTDTVVRLTDQNPPVTATISGCGHAKDQRLAVQYLAGHPEQMRQAGTTVAGGSGLAGKLLPIGILAAGLVAVLATVALLVERRRSRHLAAGGSVSVAEIRARGSRGDVGSGGDGADGGDGDGAHGGDGDDGPGRSEGVGDLRDDELGPADAGGPAPESDHDTEPAVDGATEGDAGAAADTGEPAHVLPSGYVIVEEQLFTHSGTEEPPGDDRPG